MPDFPTTQELFRIARDEVLLRNSKMTADIVDLPGSDANALTAAGVAVGDEVVGQLVRVNSSLFLTTAKDSALDKLVYDRYRLIRKGAAPAVGEVEFSTLAPVATGFPIPLGTQLRTVDGKFFSTTAQVIFPSGSSGPISAPVQSSLSGSEQQAVIGSITSITGTIPGAAPDLRVTNALATAGAADEESNEDLLVRAQKFYTTSQRGTVAAIERAALGLPGVRTALVFEAVESSGVPARIVNVVISDEFTQQLLIATVLPAGYQTQANTLSLTLRSLLLETRAAGIQVVVTLASVRILGITLLLRYKAGVDVAATSAAARAVVVSYVNSLRPGESFSRTVVEQRLATVPGLRVLGGEVLAPSADETAQPLEVLRTAPAYVVIGNS